MAKIFVFILLTSFVTQSAAQPDLGSVCQDMWDKAASNLKVPLELEVNVNPTVQNPLLKLTQTGQAKIASSIVFRTFAALLNNYADTSLQDEFFNAIMTTGGPVEQAYKYLKANNPHYVLPATTTMERFECMLRDMWFAHPGKGFSHVFVGEKIQAKAKYSGFHNWYQFYLEQSKNAISASTVTVGYFHHNTEPNFISDLKFHWGLLKKTPGSSMFVGTSPAFDLALFSVCFLALYKGAGGGNACTCSIHNSQLQMTVIEKHYNKGRVCTAYPTSVTAAAKCTSVHHTDRTNCGWLKIDHYHCAKRGCCFDSESHGGHKYWCFYPSNHKCHGILPQARQACGFPGISRNKCEGQDCCFDQSLGPGVYRCFEGKLNG